MWKRKTQFQRRVSNGISDGQLHTELNKSNEIQTNIIVKADITHVSLVRTGELLIWSGVGVELFFSSFSSTPIQLR